MHIYCDYFLKLFGDALNQQMRNCSYLLNIYLRVQVINTRFKGMYWTFWEVSRIGWAIYSSIFQDEIVLRAAVVVVAVVRGAEAIIIIIIKYFYECHLVSSMVIVPTSLTSSLHLIANFKINNWFPFEMRSFNLRMSQLVRYGAKGDKILLIFDDTNVIFFIANATVICYSICSSHMMPAQMW